MHKNFNTSRACQYHQHLHVTVFWISTGRHLSNYVTNVITGVKQEVFEKCWAHSPLRVAATLPFTRCCYCRLPPMSHAACASMSTTTTTTRDRGDRYGPIEWAQKSCKPYPWQSASIHSTNHCQYLQSHLCTHSTFTTTLHADTAICTSLILQSMVTCKFMTGLVSMYSIQPIYSKLL